MELAMKVWLKYKKEVAENTVLFGFAPDGELSYTPGQWVRLKLYLQHPDEKGDERYFSIVNPDAENIEIATRISDTGYKQTLSAMQFDDAAWISQIGGSLTMPEASNKEIVMVAGGIGITPFKCMLDHAAATGDRRPMTLLYSNKNFDNAAFYHELKKIDAEKDNIRVIFVMTRQEDWPGPKGRINSDFLKQTLPSPEKLHYMVAGPPNFVNGIGTALEEIKATDTHFEKFFGAS